MIIVIDTETTGLSAMSDELLQVAIIDDSYNVLFNSYIKPVKATEWFEAQNVNGISPDMVANAPTIAEVMPVINAILADADTIIGYNGDFDIGFLVAAGAVVPDNTEIVDVMQEFAPIYGEWSDYWCNYRWQSLSVCADYYGYEFKAHDALEDCKATLFCYTMILCE